jgi:ABC-type molybdate transport system substrate-binding protein
VLVERDFVANRTGCLLTAALTAVPVLLVSAGPTSVAGAAMSSPRVVQATDVTVLCAIALRQAMEVLIPEFQRETGHTISSGSG